MTLQQVHVKRASRPKLGAICLSLLLFFSLALMLRRADVAANCMREGLSLCARAVVPSLFPFMVISELLIASGTGEWMSIPLERILGKPLGLSRTGCCAVVLGLVCGFPVGARCATLAYKSKTIPRDECERILACSSIPSSAFLISTVGITLWESAKFGVLLYVSAIVSAILSGILLYAMQKKKSVIGCTKPSSPLAKPHFEARMLPDAVWNATRSILLICAYVVLFSTLIGTVELVIRRFSTSEVTHAILSAALELSNGMSAVAKLSNRQLAAILTGATAGWSGLSIHCQMLSLGTGCDISARPYILAKIVQTFLCAAGAYFCFLFC